MTRSSTSALIHVTTSIPLFDNCSEAGNCTEITNCTDDTNCLSLSDNVIWQPAVIQRVATIAICMLFTLVGNTAIILLLTCSRYRKRNSRVNIFIIYLAIGDLSVCFCTMTTEILFVAFGQWVLGPALCKILPYLQCVTLASTTFMLTSMSFDRYLAICKPLQYRATSARAKTFIAISWALAAFLAIPQLLIFVQVQEQRHGKLNIYCKSRGYTADWQRMVYISFLTCYVFVIPVILISFCYISIVYVVSQASRAVQQKQNNNCTLRRSQCAKGKSTFPRAKIKTLKMTFTIIATFIVCWTPFFVTTLIRVCSKYTIPVPESVMALVETTSFAQSAFNPVIYGCFNIKVKRGIRELLCFRSGRIFRDNSGYRSAGHFTSVVSENKLQRKPGHEMGLIGNTRHRDKGSLNKMSNSDSSSSLDKLGRGSSTVAATEDKQNGVRLRVRFTSKDQFACLPSESLDLCQPEVPVTYDILQHSQVVSVKVPLIKHNSAQQLYQ